MADIFDGIINATDFQTVITDAKLNAILKDLVQKSGQYSRTIKSAPYAPTATTLWLQVDDTTYIHSYMRFNVQYLDKSAPLDVKSFWWSRMSLADPGDGSDSIFLDGTAVSGGVGLVQGSHTLGSGGGQFDLTTALVANFKIWRADRTS